MHENCDNNEPSNRTKYTYDGFGQRLIKTVSASYGEIYQYGQDGMLLEETNASGVAQADYIYLNGRPVAVYNGSTLYFLHDDRLGTPQLATDSAQNTQWQASYEPFGQASVSGTITQNLRLPGQYFDVESGWNHNGFRDDLPVLGRYAEPDPMGRLGSGNNLYAYAFDNPVDLADPMGLCAAMSGHTNCTGSGGGGNGLDNGMRQLAPAMEAQEDLEFIVTNDYLLPVAMIGTGAVVAVGGAVATVALAEAGPIGWALMPITASVALSGAALAVEGGYYGVTHRFINPANPFGPPTPSTPWLPPSVEPGCGQ